MNKKGLSILLALSMVFSLNTMAFAEEAVTEEAVVEEVAVAAEDDVVTQSEQSLGKYEDRWLDAYDKVSCNKISMNGTTLETRGQEVVFYTGNKITASRLGLRIVDTETGYAIPVKKIKLTNNKKANAVGVVNFKITSIAGIKDIGWTKKDNEGILVSDAKEAYKNIKTKFKTAKNQELSAYVMDTWIEDSVSDAYIKELKSKKKTLSAADIDKMGYIGELGAIGNCVLVTTKNGTVKKVQLPYVEYKHIKNKGRDTLMYTAKIKFKTLKKGKDYTVSGEFAVFKDSSTFTSDKPIKAKS